MRAETRGVEKTTATEVGEYAAERVDGLLRRLAYQIGRTAKLPHATEVHDLRVAIRRFEQALTCFGSCFSNKAIKKIERRLEKIMDAAGEVRNCDIAIEVLSRSKSPRVSLLSAFRKQRKDSERDLTRVLRRWSHRGSYSKWRAELRTGGQSAANRELGTAAEGTLQPMVERFLDRGRKMLGAKAPAEKAHRLRLSAKRLRYSLELFETVYGTALKGWLERMKALQNSLGAISDCETVRAMIRAEGGDARLDATLRRRTRKRTEEFRRIWTDVFSDGSIRDFVLQTTRKTPRKPAAHAVSRGREIVSPKAAHG